MYRILDYQVKTNRLNLYRLVGSYPANYFLKNQNLHNQDGKMNHKIFNNINIYT